MQNKGFIVVAGVIGFVATFCTVAGIYLHKCISELDNIPFLFDILEEESLSEEEI